MECWLPDAIKELGARWERQEETWRQHGSRHSACEEASSRELRARALTTVDCFVLHNPQLSVNLELTKMSGSDKANDKSESQHAILGHTDRTECWGKVLLNMGAPGSGWSGASV